MSIAPISLSPSVTKHRQRSIALRHCFRLSRFRFWGNDRPVRHDIMSFIFVVSSEDEHRRALYLFFPFLNPSCQQSTTATDIHVSLTRPTPPFPPPLLQISLLSTVTIALSFRCYILPLSISFRWNLFTRRIPIFLCCAFCYWFEFSNWDVLFRLHRCYLWS